MIDTTIEDFKARLWEFVELVQKGERVVLRGEGGKGVAVLQPYPGAVLNARRLGIWRDRGEPVFRDWSVTEEQLLGET